MPLKELMRATEMCTYTYHFLSFMLLYVLSPCVETNTIHCACGLHVTEKTLLADYNSLTHRETVAGYFRVV